jgi:hypothetical protein
MAFIVEKLNVQEMFISAILFSFKTFFFML